MKRSKRPFAFGLRTTYDVFSWLTSINFFRYLLMVGGLYSLMLSLELTMLGLNGNPVMDILPGAEKRLEKTNRTRRFVPKGVDDGADPSRINPLPTISQHLARRTDAIALYGITGPFGNAEEDAWTRHAKKKILSKDLEWTKDEKELAAESYELLTNNPVSIFLRGFEVGEENLFREEELGNTMFLIGVWLGIGGIQSWVWRTVSRSWFERMFNQTNAVRRKKASKDSITTTKIYEVGFNIWDALIFLLFAGLFIGTYWAEFAINGRGLSPQVNARIFFKLAAVFGFEGSILMVTGLGDDLPTGKNPPPTPAPKKDPPK